MLTQCAFYCIILHLHLWMLTYKLHRTLFFVWGTSWIVSRRHSSRPNVSHPKLPVSSLFTAEIQWRLGTRKNALRWTMHAVLKYAKLTQNRKRKQRDVFPCRQFHSAITSWSFEYGGDFISASVENERIVSVNLISGLPVQQSRTRSHSVATYSRTRTFWFLLCFRKRVLILNVVL